MIYLDTSKRSEQAEIMDDFDLQGIELEQTLTDLENINLWLGGNNITLNGVKKIIDRVPLESVIRIADVGCGSGAILREIAKWGRVKNIKLELIGIDANTHAIEIAQRRSAYFPEIKYSNLNIFSEEYQQRSFDIVLCTLTLHHFKNDEILRLLNTFKDQARLGVVVNDLQRSKLAYILFQVFSKVFINNEIARKDGLISILRGFKRKDLMSFAKHFPEEQHSIQWKWAFRYRWILKK